MRNIFQFIKRKRLIFIIIALIVVLYLAYKQFLAPKPEFETTEVKRGTVAEELILSGEIKAEEHSMLSFLSSGELDYVGVTEGQVVKKGDILARLDTTVLQQAYLSAEADLRKTEASKAVVYDEIQGHSNDESYSQKEERTIAEANRDKAYRAYISAQKNLANATLRAPFDGIISSITHPYTGINTSLTESQIEIINPKSILFEVSADQSEVNQIKMGQKVNIVLDSFSDKEFEGVVMYIALTPKAGETGAVYKVKVRFSDESADANQFRVGMTGDAKFVLSQNEAVLFVPTSFINTDIKGNYLKVGKPNNKVYVELGLEGEDRTEIKNGVSEGDLLYD